MAVPWRFRSGSATARRRAFPPGGPLWARERSPGRGLEGSAGSRPRGALPPGEPGAARARPV